MKATNKLKVTEAELKAAIKKLAGKRSPELEKLRAESRARVAKKTAH